MRKKAHKKNVQQDLAQRIRTECNRRGWSVGELARRAGISRTTLHQLERALTVRPQIKTIRKVAAALDLPVEALLDPAQAETPAIKAGPERPVVPQRFDAATNPAVAETLREQPQLFNGWSQDDLDELCSLFGTGGSLTPRGVELAAEAINRRRETVHKLQIILETDLREEAIKFVDLLYRMVQPPQMRQADTTHESAY